MFLPIGTDRPLNRPTLVNHILILFNVAVFCLCAALTGFEAREFGWVTKTFGLGRGATDWWRWVTYAFVHADLWHILGNMLFLWVFGPVIEDRLGRIGYLFFFLAGAAAAGAAHLAASPVSVVGASGAVAAVTGAFLILCPRVLVRTFVFFIFIGVFNIPAMWYIAFSIARDVIGFGHGAGNVSYAAHLGGYAFGVPVALALLATKILPREDYDVFYMIRQARRRREINDAIRESQDRFRRGAGAAGEASGKKGKAVVEIPEVPIEVANARAALSAALNEDTRALIPERYQALLSAFDAAKASQLNLNPALEVLSSRAQLECANRLFELGERALAARAYRGFLSQYEKDPQAGVVRVMLALLMVRYLEQRQQAKAVLDDAIRVLTERGNDEEHLSLARSLLSEIANPSQAT
ncbi:MAG: rhomboid family intramembrane serine protease [Phycisphaerales bacterium]|nr:rhomboid family intramembrane serine protease [Phycisphaerales bacterium]